MKRYIAEFVATFFLVFVGAASIVTDFYRARIGAFDSSALVGIALAYGLALAIAIAAVGHISGGHVNPVVTVASFVTRRISGRDMVGYLVAQILGGIFGGLLVRLVSPSEAYSFAGGGAPGLGDGVSAIQGIGLEAILTFFLVFTIWGVVVDERGPRHLAPFSIGLVLTFDVLAGGSFTGAAVNPARWFGPALVAGSMENAVVWLAGPLLGALAASFLYESVFLGEEPPKEPVGPGGVPPEAEEAEEEEEEELPEPAAPPPPLPPSVEVPPPPPAR